MSWTRFEIPILGTIGAFILAWLVSLAGKAWTRNTDDRRERYRRQKLANTFAILIVVISVVLVWSRVLQHTSTFLGLIGAGLAVALREPLLSIAGRIAIFVGHMYSVQFSNSSIFGTPVFNYTQNFSYIWDEIKIPVTYASNVESMKKLMLEAGRAYTGEFLQEAETDLERMQRFFVVPDIDLKPAVFLKVTDNWVEMTLRYIVDPKKRRAASTFLYGKASGGLTTFKSRHRPWTLQCTGRRRLPERSERGSGAVVCTSWCASGKLRSS